MSSMAFLVTYLFYTAALICILTSLYLLYININNILNKLAFLFCTSLSCWCVGTACSLIASNYVDSMVWRRFAVIGAGTFFSFFLHYIIILIEDKELMKKKWAKYAIYIPSVIIVYFLAISKKVSYQLYHLKKTQMGWISTSGFNLGSLFFDIYIISFMLIGLCMVYRWKRNRKGKHKQKQANHILISYFIAFMVAIIAEIADKCNINSYIHEVIPLILIIPMFTVCYEMKRHDFMKADIMNEDTAFMERFRTNITKYLEVAFYLGGIIYFVSQYMHDRNAEFNKVILFSLLLCFFGLVIHVIQKYIADKELEIILYSLLLSVCIPVITLRFIEYAAVTVWAFPFLIIIAALLFNNATVLVMISTSMILTQLYMWIKDSNCVVMVDASDFFTRVGLMGMAIGLIYYINKIYLFRLRQLSDRIKVQDFLFQISSRMINVSSNNIEEKMDEILHLLCENINADRAHIYYQNDQVGIDDLGTYYCWCNEQSRLDDEVLQDRSISEYTWWKHQIKDAEVVQIFDVSQMNQDAQEIKETLMKQKVQSMLVVPLITDKQKIGFLRIDFVQNPKEWDDEFVKMMVTVGNILGEANIKVSSEKQVEYMAYYDQLTNIPNRQLFGIHINQAIQRAGKTGNLIGILFLNLDSFKIVNDTMGHDYGDKILITIADRLTKCLRKTDTVSRFCGDEFLIMLNSITAKKDIETVVNKIVGQFEKPIMIDNEEFNITVSIGVSAYPTDGIDKDTLIKNADIAMDQAKSNGKNQYKFCSQEMKDRMQQTMILTNYLYHAQDRDEIRIVFQPQVSLESGKVVAMEALARWNHAELGLVSPAMFIPIAERTGLINSIGEWILREACIQNKSWQEMGLPPVRLAVNVSVIQLLDPDFVSKVKAVLEETGLESCYLELEVTENIAIQESEFIIHVLTELKALGVSLAIDDFGIEYSSLSRIKMLPIDRLKIDMHFIKGIQNSEKDKVIVDVIIKLAKDLGLKVIAEGVEQEEQLHFLELKECDEIQGFYFYKPLSKEDMQEVLRGLCNKIE